jgi:hypothetical protein
MADAEMYHAVLIPGGNIINGRLADRNFPRIDKALEIYKQQALTGEPPLLVAVGAHQLFRRGRTADGKFEANLIFDELVRNDIPSDDIKIAGGWDSNGNAVKAKTDVLLPLGLKRVALVTNRSVMKRQLKSFDHILGDDFELIGIEAADKWARLKQIFNIWGYLTQRLILGGVERGDHEAVWERLEKYVPGYGDTSKFKLRVKSIINFVLPKLFEYQYELSD